MNGPLRQRRLLTSTLQCCQHNSSQYLTPLTQRRTFLGGISGLFGGGNKDKKKSKSAGSLQDRNADPLLAEYLSRPIAGMKQPKAEAGELSSESVFAADKAERPEKPEQSRGQRVQDESGAGHTKARTVEDMATVLDPNPTARIRWQRRKVMQMVRRGERLTHDQFIQRTERSVDVKSHNFKTSVKKLGPLARQITGKTVEDALVQMRFGAKKAARDVREHLEYARDKAIVSRGMGLGAASEGSDVGKELAMPVDIRDKSGKRRTIEDLSNMYVDQAWVGRGPYGKLPDYRARGQVNIMRTPWTHLTLRLKEETTLVREHTEREAKRTRKRLEKPWVPLPDRPIYGQNQYHTW